MNSFSTPNNRRHYTTVLLSWNRLIFLYIWLYLPIKICQQELHKVIQVNVCATPDWSYIKHLSNYVQFFTNYIQLFKLAVPIRNVLLCLLQNLDGLTYLLQMAPTPKFRCFTFHTQNFTYPEKNARQFTVLRLMDVPRCCPLL